MVIFLLHQFGRIFSVFLIESAYELLLDKNNCYSKLSEHTNIIKENIS